MSDIVFVATIVAFFILCLGYISVCGRIIGPDDTVTTDPQLEDLEADAQLERAA